MNINVQRLFYSSWRMAVRETVQPWHLGNPPRLAACSAYGAGFLDDGRAPYASQNKKAYEHKCSAPLLFFLAHG
ncbi:hypothetical protein [Eubacterium sp. An11]|uniref:hypothetical protein n=1 Tax=Eubacterium sp. An11 TaxID=1965542 RepID=UPI0013A65AF0|nr:hypothetical protein [Eubacterium sp. An11]